jgi:hypothetical protein
VAPVQALPIDKAVVVAVLAVLELEQYQALRVMVALEQHLQSQAQALHGREVVAVVRMI